MVFIHGALTYPSTSSGANAQVNISGVGVNFLAANACSFTTVNVTAAARLFSLASSTNFDVVSNAQAAITNTAMSTAGMTFSCVYPAS
jgi:hypothetical protein